MRDYAAGCPTKQTNIVHSSLMRILTPEQLSPATRHAIQEKCREWTEQLHGTQLHLPEAWWGLPTNSHQWHCVNGDNAGSQVGMERFTH